MKGLIYLASPYTHKNKIQRDVSYLQALRTCHVFNECGIPIFSPIVYGHQFAVNCGAPLGYEYWKPLDSSMQQVCTELLILQIDGWKVSSGISEEITEFEIQDKKIGYINMLEVAQFENGKISKIRANPYPQITGD